MAKGKESAGHRKNRIVKAAIHCFIKNGVAKTTLKEVAQTAKVDQPLVHYYFPTLDSLYADVVQVVLEDLKEHSLEAITKDPTDIVKTLRHYVRTPFSWIKKQPGYGSLWMYFYYLSSYDLFFTRMNRMIRENGRDRISVFLYKGIEAGVFKLPPQMSVSELAVGIQGLMTGNAIMAGSEDHKVLDEYADITEKQILRLLQIKV